MNFTWTRRHTWGTAVIFLLAALTFGSLLGVGPINWDDDTNIFKNPYYLKGQWGPYWTNSYFGLFVPVTSLVWHLLFVLGGGAAWPYRVLNVSLHLANTALLLAILLFLARRWGSKSPSAAILAVAVFALHPVQVQAVAWISGGRDLLSAFFALLSLIVFFRLKPKAAAVCATLLFTLAVLSKPNAVVLAVLIPVFSYFLDRGRFRLSLFTATACLTVAGISILMTLSAQKDYLTPFHWWQRVLILGDTFTFYVQKIFFPYPLSANYERRPEILLQTWEPVWRTALAIALGVPAVLWMSKKYPRVTLPLLAWAMLLLPVSGLVPFGYQRVSTTADHYLYLPMAAFAAGVLLLPVARLWLPVGLAVVLSLSAFARTRVWTSDAAFFNNMAAYSPDSYSTGMGMSVLKCKGERDFKSGIEWIQKSLRERPDEIMALSNLAYCYFNSKDWPNTVALLDKLDAMNIAEMEEKQPTAFSSFLASVGSALFEVDRFREGFQLICHAYRIKPDGENNHYNLVTAAQLMRNKGLEPVCKYPFDWR